MKSTTTIVIMLTSLLFAQGKTINIGEANILHDRLKYSSTIDLNRFEQFYVPITATAINDFSYMNISDGNSEKPPLSALRIGGQIVTGISLGFVVYTYLYLKFSNRDLFNPYISDKSIIYTYLGYMGGVATGVYLVGIIGNQSGSFLYTSIGSLSGWLLALGTDMLLKPTDDITNYIALWFPSILATILFNISRKFDSNYKANGITNINVIEQTLHFGIPNLNIFRFNKFDSFGIKLEVINVNF